MNKGLKGDQAPLGLWDSDALWAKAVRYTARALDQPRESAWFPFYASLTLEYLGRSAIANVHPVLLADPRDEENFFYAFGVGRTSRPRSIPAHTVFSRCVRFVPDFTPEMSVWCNSLAERRNEELHSAGLAFDALESSVWLPKFYRTLKVLCAFWGRDLEALLGNDEAEVALQLVAEADEATVSLIKERIGRASASAAQLSESERESLLEVYEWPPVTGSWLWETVTCPACASPGRCYGPLVRTQAPRLEDDTLIEAEICVRDLFQCAVCGLELTGDLELDAAGMAGSFTIETAADPDDYYGERYMERYADGYDDYGNC